MNGTIDYSVLENEQLAKLESGSRANVLFKPSKKMKKRRQLDALVSNGKKIPRRKNSGHELLRSNDDSDSSEVEEFSVLDSQKWGRRWSSPSCCSVSCPMLTCLLLAALGVMGGAGLLWMNLTLRHTCDQLQDRLTQVENRNAGMPDELQAMQARVVSLNKTVSSLKTGTGGLVELNKSLLSLKTQVTSLTTTTADLQKNVQASSPNKEQLAVANTVAELGSDLQKMRTDLQTLDTSQKSLSSQLQNLTDHVTVLENPSGRERGSPSTISPSLQTLVSEINATFTHSMALALDALNKQQAQLNAVDQFSQTLSNQVTEIRQLVTNLTDTQPHQATPPHQGDTGEAGGEAPGEAVSLTELQGQVTSLQHVVNQVWAAHNMSLTEGSEGVDTDPLSSLMKDHQDFVLFRADISHQLEDLQQRQGQLNISVRVLNSDVAELFVKLGVAMDDVTNITQIMAQFMQGQRTTPAPRTTTSADDSAHAGEGVTEAPSATVEDQGSSRHPTLQPSTSEQHGEDSTQPSEGNEQTSDNSEQPSKDGEQPSKDEQPSEQNDQPNSDRDSSGTEGM